MESSSTAPQHPVSGQDVPEAQTHAKYPPDAGRCADELLSIVAYLTAPDGPLQAFTDAEAPGFSLHRRLLGKAAERLEVIDSYLRARVAFLVAGRDRGYHAPQEELDLAGAALDATRAATAVVGALLDGGLPSSGQYEVLGVTALRINPALEAAREAGESRAG